MKKNYLLSFTACLSIWMHLCSIHNGYATDYVSASQQGEDHEMSTSSVKRQRHESIVDHHQTYDNHEQMTPLVRSHSHHYAIATTDTAFKHLLSLAQGSDKKIVISFLNSFIPAFHGDPIRDVEEAPVALPILRRPGEKQTFMDLHVVSSAGVHYLIEMQAQRHVMFDERALFYAAST